MADTTKHASRRVILKTGLRTGMTLLAGVVLADHAVAQQKVAPAAVQYQPTPKNNQKCSECVHFVAPNACKLVSGYISPNAWCAIYAPKPT